MGKRVVDDTSLSSVADSIRGKTGKADALTFPEGFSAGVEDVFAAGEKSEYDRFWDAYQDKGTRKNYQRAFASGWSEDTFRPKYDMKPTNALHLFYGAKIATDLRDVLNEQDVILDLGGAAANNAVGYAFASSLFTALPAIDLSGITVDNYNTVGIFGWTSYLHTIEKIILKDDGTTTIASNWFNSSTALRNLAIEGIVGTNGLNLQWSAKLSHASIESVINALATTTSGLTVTLPLTAVNAAFETEEDAADGSTSEEWAALAATKSNWTISLV